VRILKKVGDDQLAMDIRKRHNISDPVEALGILDIAKAQLLLQIGGSQ